jgi:uncharacterized protein
MLNRLLHTVAILLTIVGAINWGLVGAFDFNLVTTLFGTMPMVVKAVYILVGLSGLAVLYCKVTEHKLF